MNLRLMMGLPVVLLVAACQQESGSEQTDELESETITQVVVTECYNSGGDISIAINGSPLLLTPAGQRDDTTGICFWDGISLPSSLSLSSNEQSVSLRNEREKALLIPATEPGAARFVNKSELLFD
ncbi:hypothetical protein [Altererythrobacter sp. MF3-039]|uniref:hypothetical protein n=1 Tax=Altererythrobacter sp. MF3-039 TaxID=3252901 RepID=UPI00390C5192